MFDLLQKAAAHNTNMITVLFHLEALKSRIKSFQSKSIQPAQLTEAKSSDFH